MCHYLTGVEKLRLRPPFSVCGLANAHIACISRFSIAAPVLTPDPVFQHPVKVE
jgi:hypothetical protein